MARFLLPAILLYILTLGASPSASQEKGFQSINYGGEALTDPKTNITWDADPWNQSNDNLHGKVGKVNSSTNVMTTLRFFPNDSRNRKFCYLLGEVTMGKTYLLRASFLYGNYDGLNQPPTFVLILNSHTWTNVSTSSTTPIIHELIFISNDDALTICLAPIFTSIHTPFISTLELRPLESAMYNNSEGAFSKGYGLMLWKRINYGALTKAETRYPDDPFDRIWEANTTGPTLVSPTPDMLGLDYVSDPAQPPREVMATAITTNTSTRNLSFTYDGFGGFGGFLFELHFQEVDEKTRGRNISFAIGGRIFRSLVPGFGGPVRALFDGTAELPIPLEFTLLTAADSPLGPLLNAIELFQWTPQPLPATFGTFQGDVYAIEQVQLDLNLMGHGQGDPCLPKGYTWTWIECSDETEPRITKINLTHFNLIGHIPPYINNLTSLKIIDLSNNMLNGAIPDVNLLSNLEYLDLHNNTLSGELPQSLLSLRKLAKIDVSKNNLCGSLLSFPPSTDYTDAGNTRLCDGCNCSSGSSSNSSMPPTLAIKNNNTRKYIIAMSFLAALYVVSMLILLALYKARHSRAKEEKSTSAIPTNQKGVDDLKDLTFISKMFTYNEIKSATLNFTTLLGEGGFGKVYHGLLPTGEAIAVKMLADSSKQGLKEFYNEVAILSRVRHKNLVSLIGYCVENTYMLIYEYISKGNLRDLIYGDVESTDKPLPWTTRLRIAQDASQGLAYLHMGCDPAIIHRDVKSSNILLSDKMQAKVSDFGLSRLKEGDNVISHVSTVNVVGTPGYLDPAYNSTNQLTDKSDVYSFGIVLFELICGRAPIDMFSSPPHIVDWATQAIVQGEIGDIVDPMLAKGYKVESMWKVIDMALGCVEGDRAKRPKMSEVSQLLRNALEVEMDPSNLQDVSGSSATSDGKQPTLQYLESLRMKLAPR